MIVSVAARIAAVTLLVSHASAQEITLSGALLKLQESIGTMEEWLQTNKEILEPESQDVLLRLPESERTDATPPSTDSGTLVISVDGTDVDLRDVARNSWFAPYVRRAAELGIIGGYRDASGTPTGLFGPADPVTVSELAKLAVLTSGINPVSCPAAENPKADGAWFSQVMGCAEKQGWVLYSDKTVDPLRPALRGEVVVTMLQALRVSLSPVTDSGPFDDVTASTQYASAIARAKRDGIVRGYSSADGTPTGMFGPTDNVTRAEAAKIVLLSKDVYKP